MTLKRCRKTGIVDLLALDSVRSNKLFPNGKHTAFISQQSKQLLDGGDFRMSISRAHPEAIIFQRACCYRPEFVEHLWNNGEFMSNATKEVDCIHAALIMSVLWLSGPQQDVRVDQNPHQS